MAYFEEGSVAMLALEAMVDKVGIRNVMYALKHICEAKAAHVAENWQDATTAKEWMRAAGKIGAFARNLKREGGRQKFMVVLRIQSTTYAYFSVSAESATQLESELQSQDFINGLWDNPEAELRSEVAEIDETANWKVQEIGPSHAD